MTLNYSEIRPDYSTCYRDLKNIGLQRKRRFWLSACICFVKSYEDSWRMTEFTPPPITKKTTDFSLKSPL